MSDAMWRVVDLCGGSRVYCGAGKEAEAIVDKASGIQFVKPQIQRYVPGIGWVPASQCGEGRA